MSSSVQHGQDKDLPTTAWWWKSDADAEDVQPRHQCCSKPGTAGRSLGFGRTAGMGQAAEELHPSSAAFGCCGKIIGNIFV